MHACDYALCVAMTRALHAPGVTSQVPSLKARWVIADRVLPAMHSFPSPPPPTLIDSTARGLCGCYLPVSVLDSRPMPGGPLPGTHAWLARCMPMPPALVSLRIIMYFSYFLLFCIIRPVPLIPSNHKIVAQCASLWISRSYQHACATPSFIWYQLMRSLTSS